MANTASSYSSGDPHRRRQGASSHLTPIEMLPMRDDVKAREADRIGSSPSKSRNSSPRKQSPPPHEFRFHHHKVATRSRRKRRAALPRHLAAEQAGRVADISGGTRSTRRSAAPARNAAASRVPLVR